jgi:ATP-dependent Clp protease adaptor protein ClpS
MIDVLLADSILSGMSEIQAGLAFATLAIAGGLFLGYLLGGLIARPRERQRSACEATGEPLYAVVLHNDDFNTFGFVIGVLGKVFTYGGPYSLGLALKVHCSGRGVIWQGTLEAAELKAQQIRTFGPDPNGRRGVEALRVSVQALRV